MTSIVPGSQGSLQRREGLVVSDLLDQALPRPLVKVMDFLRMLVPQVAIVHLVPDSLHPTDALGLMPRSVLDDISSITGLAACRT